MRTETITEPMIEAVARALYGAPFGNGAEAADATTHAERLLREECSPGEVLLVRRAVEEGGECAMGYGEASATMRLTERGIGHWEQRHPFVATYVLTPGPKEEA